MSESQTSLSLLGRLSGGSIDAEAWTEFVARYGPRIQLWCQRWGLQEADAADTTQNVLLQLARQMQNFEYRADGRFRSWLKVITWRAFADHLERRKRTPTTLESEIYDQLILNHEAKDDLMATLDAEADRQALELAMQRVSTRVAENTMEAFRLMALEGLSGKETARQLSMKVGSVFVAKARVEKMLIKEVAVIEALEEAV
ncbi:MAG: RNA polymerase sigma factor [Planctomycetota bacterium]